MWGDECPPPGVLDKVLKLCLGGYSRFLGWDWAFPWPLPMTGWEYWASCEEIKLDSGLRGRFLHNIIGEGPHHLECILLQACSHPSGCPKWMASGIFPDSLSPSTFSCIENFPVVPWSLPPYCNALQAKLHSAIQMCIPLLHTGGIPSPVLLPHSLPVPSLAL